MTVVDYTCPAFYKAVDEGFIQYSETSIYSNNKGKVANRGYYLFKENSVIDVAMITHCPFCGDKI